MQTHALRMLVVLVLAMQVAFFERVSGQDYVIDLTAQPPSRSDFESQILFQALDLAGAHQQATGAGTRIAILDSGFDLSYQQVTLFAQRDFIDGDTDVLDFADGLDQDGDGVADDAYSHGTATLSLLRSVAPNAEFGLYRVMDEEGVADPTTVAAAIDRAIQDGAWVINVSVVLQQDNAQVAAALQRAFDRQVLVVGPSGNDGGLVAAYVGNYPLTLCVGSTDNAGMLFAGATNGPEVDILAPGVELVVAHPASPTGFALATGTSFATPLVSGAAALLLEKDPQASVAELRDELTSNADSVSLTATQAAQGLCGKSLNLLEAVQ